MKGDPELFGKLLSRILIVDQGGDDLDVIA